MLGVVFLLTFVWVLNTKLLSEKPDHLTNRGFYCILAKMVLPCIF